MRRTLSMVVTSGHAPGAGVAIYSPLSAVHTLAVQRFARHRHGINVVFAVGLVGCGGPPQTRAGGAAADLGRPAGQGVDFELADARDAKKSLRLSDFRGRPVVVHFFTTWCAPCEAEFQSLNALAAEHAAAADLAILGVALDLDGKKLLPIFLEVRGLQYPVALADERMLHGETPLGPVKVVPATFLVDRDGNLAEKFEGVVPGDHLRARLAALPKP